MAKNKNPPCFFPILGIPPEVRNLIWKNTVITAEVIKLGQHGSQHTRGQLALILLRSGKQIHVEIDKRLVPSRLAVAFTCRQFYLEITPIYYSHNWFAVPLTSKETALGAIRDFVTDIGPENARCIRKLCLELPEVMALFYLLWIFMPESAEEEAARLAVLTSFLVETQAIFIGETSIVLTTRRTVLMTVLRPDGKIVHLSDWLGRLRLVF